MTGSNRLLIGLGWPMVGLIYAAKCWRTSTPAVVRLEPHRRVDLAFLGVASLYAFKIPLMRRISIEDALVLLGLFGVYMWRAGKQEAHEPELVGVAGELASLPKGTRRSVVAGLFVFAAVAVLAVAKPFADGLIGAGKSLGVDEFLLVQWLAPLASEAPELIVAAVLAARGNVDAGIGTLLASKVNQWTLLVGSLPLGYVAGGGGWSLGLDARQVEELTLTSTQTVLGFAALCKLRFSTWEAWVLLGLFALQFLFPHPHARMLISVAYAALALGLLVRHRSSIPPVAAAFRRA